MNSLRQELLAVKDQPTMRMLLPAGWEVISLEDDGVQSLIDRLRAVLMRANRPDIDAYLTSSLTKWLTELKARGGCYAVLPLDPPVGTALPMSLAVSVVSEVGGRRLDEWVTAKIRTGATEFLDDRNSVLAWSMTTAGQDQMAGTVSDQFQYLIPVPGSERRSAVLLSGTLLVLEGEPEDSPRRRAARALYDSVALALDWVPASIATRSAS